VLFERVMPTPRMLGGGPLRVRHDDRRDSNRPVRKNHLTGRDSDPTIDALTSSWRLRK
jgi:hypothetical protein